MITLGLIDNVVFYLGPSLDSKGLDWYGEQERENY